MQHWIQLSPYGTFDHPQGKQTITYWDAQQCISNTQTFRFYIGLKKIPVYIGHPDDPLFQNPQIALDANVYGHLTRLKADANGLWAQIHWTLKGIALIQTQQYWYLSPRWLLSKNDTQTSYHPELLLSIGLTQYPNLPVQAFGEHATSGAQPMNFCALLQRIYQNAYHAFESAYEHRTYRYRCFAKIVWLAWIINFLANTIFKRLTHDLKHQGRKLAKYIHRWLHTHRIISNERKHFSRSSTDMHIFRFNNFPWDYNFLAKRSQKRVALKHFCIASHSKQSTVQEVSNEPYNSSFMDNTDSNHNQPRRCWMMRLFAFCFNVIQCGIILILKTISWIIHGIFHFIGFVFGLLAHAIQWLFHAIFGEPPSTVLETANGPEIITTKEEAEPQKHIIIVCTKKMIQKLAKRYKKILQRKKRAKSKSRKATKRNHAIIQKQKTFSKINKPTDTTKNTWEFSTKDPISKDLRQVQSRNEKLRILQFTEKVQERIRTTGESYPEAWHAVHKQYTSDQPIASDGSKGSTIHSHPITPSQQEK